MTAAEEVEQLRATLRYVLPGLPVLTRLLERGGFERGAAQARAMEQAISAALADTHPERKTFGDLVAWLALQTGLSSEALQSDSREARISRVRFAAMWGGVKLLHLSASQVARGLGHRHHSTVLHGVRRAEALIATDPAFLLLVDRMNREVGK